MIRTMIERLKIKIVVFFTIKSMRIIFDKNIVGRIILVTSIKLVNYTVSSNIFNSYGYSAI
jgi:hypothetical protein